jgi:heme oxygenase
MSTEAAVENNPRKEGLALQLDDGTRKSHSVAQNSAFVTGFFKGLSNRDSYSKLLTSLYFVYVTMEDSFDSTTEAMVKQMDNPELRRVDAASEDMEYFFGKGWKDKIKPSAAAKKYVARVEEVAKNKPRLLIAHQYTRYLGDLFGGQVSSKNV